MSIGWELFRFPFDDKRWVGKAFMGLILLAVGAVVWPLLLPVMGYGVRVMRGTIQGDPPALPEWDDWGSLFADGFRAMVIGLVCGAPIWLFNCVVLVLAFTPGPFLTLIQETDPEAAFAATMAAMAALSVASMMVLGLLLMVALPLSFLGLVALSRSVAQGTLSSAFEFAEVWKLAKTGFKNYVVSFAVCLGLGFAVLAISSAVNATCILACLYPVIAGLGALYITVMLGATLGQAYYCTQNPPTVPVLAESTIVATPTPAVSPAEKPKKPRAARKKKDAE